MSWRALCLLACTASVVPAAAVEPVAPSEELLEYLGTWNGDDDWLLSDEVIAMTATPQPRVGKSSGTSPEEERRDDPAAARDRTEQRR